MISLRASFGILTAECSVLREPYLHEIEIIPYIQLLFRLQQDGEKINKRLFKLAVNQVTQNLKTHRHSCNSVSHEQYVNRFLESPRREVFI